MRKSLRTQTKRFGASDTVGTGDQQQGRKKLGALYCAAVDCARAHCAHLVSLDRPVHFECFWHALVVTTLALNTKTGLVAYFVGLCFQYVSLIKIETLGIEDDQTPSCYQLEVGGR